MNEQEINKRTDEISGWVLKSIAALLTGGLSRKEALITAKCMVALVAEVERNPRVSEVALADEARSWVKAELRKL